MEKKKNFKRLGARRRLFLMLTILILLLIGCYTYIFVTLRTQTTARLDNSAYQTAVTLLEQTSHKVDTLNNITSYLLNEHYRNDRMGFIFPYLSDYSVSEDSYAALSKAFNMSTDSLFYLFPSLEGLYLYTNEGHPIIFNSRDLTRLSAPSLANVSWLNDVAAQKGRLVLLKNNQMPDQPSSNYLYATRCLINIHDSFTPACVVVAQLDIHELNLSFERQQSYKGQSYALLDSDYGVLSTNRNFPIEELTENLSVLNKQTKSTQSTYTYTRFKQNGFFYHLVTDMSTGLSCIISTPTHIISYKPLVIISLSLLLVLLGNILFVRYTFYEISRPIQALIKACTEIGRGNFSCRLPIPADTEFGYLTNSFNQMTEKVENLINTVYLKDIAERDLELQMLRNQINPHFLYNTLESMRMTAYAQGSYDLSQMCMLLADVLRYGVSSPTELVTLKDELEHLQEYITLQQYRLHYSVKINIMVSQDVYDCFSLKLMFQPLVENALNHGFAGFTGNERIDILGYEKDGILYFQVTDNGIGMSPKHLETLSAYIKGENNDFSSIGLKNVHRRIELYYGSGYGLTLDSHVGKGTSVQIKLPAQHHTKEENHDI